MSCEDSVDLYFVKTPNGQEKFKLLQQAHCAKCWRPLIYNTAWPGSHENLRPPFQSALRTPISVTQCGHIFHTTCSSLVTHCPVCQVLIQRLKPLHLHTVSQAPSNGQNSNFNVAEMERLIHELKIRLDSLSAEVIRLQKQISPTQNNRNHHNR